MALGSDHTHDHYYPHHLLLQHTVPFQCHCTCGKWYSKEIKRALFSGSLPSSHLIIQVGTPWANFNVRRVSQSSIVAIAGIWSTNRIPLFECPLFIDLLLKCKSGCNTRAFITLFVNLLATFIYYCILSTTISSMETLHRAYSGDTSHHSIYSKLGRTSYQCTTRQRHRERECAQVRLIKIIAANGIRQLPIKNLPLIS